MKYKTYNYAINGLRGLCILMIFAFHVEHSRIIPDLNTSEMIDSIYEAFRYFIDSFKFGVEIFFMISGYVIIGSLHRHKTLLGFFRDRVIRIYPTWVPLHILSFIGGPIIARGIFEIYDPELWTLSFFTNLFFLTPILPYPTVHPPTWSLCYEWFFYFISGFCAFILIQKQKILKYVGIALFCGLVLVMFNYFPRSIFFVPGVLLALYKDRFEIYKSYFVFPLASMVVFLLAWQATGADLAERAVAGEQIVDWVFDGRIFYLLIAMIAGGYSFACVVFGQGYLSKILCHPLMQFFCNLSYAFYLWSPVMMMLMKMVAMKFIEPIAGIWIAILFFAVTSFILSVIVSWLNWVIIEKKFASYIKANWFNKNERVIKPAE